MARILIGNIKGPQGPTGPKGSTGATGPAGPQGPLPPLIANYLATATGKGALDAYMGKLIDQRLTELSNGLTELNGELVPRFVGNTSIANALSIEPEKVFGVLAFWQVSDSPPTLPNGFLMYFKNHALTSTTQLIAFRDGGMVMGQIFQGRITWY